jgi:hypothetical protein
MSMVDPWEKAAECQRAIETATDRGQRLRYLRELWIALGKQRDSDKRLLTRRARASGTPEGTSPLNFG